jgi:hypothetical protein
VQYHTRIDYYLVSWFAFYTPIACHSLAGVNPSRLSPLPYHEAIRDFLKREEAAVWNWFASHAVGEDQADAVRFDLLKKTYRIERTADPQLYAMADEAAQALDINAPITIYQAQHPEGLNALLAYVPGEAHIVFSGSLKSKLNEGELRALLAHELAHYCFWQGWGGDFLVADQILAALTYDERASSAHAESARLFQLYHEIFCDRGALRVAGDPLVVVSLLVKITTGIDEIDAASYVRQAEEVLSRPGAKAAELTHPEAFIRARALTLWHDQDENADGKIAEMIEGPLAFDELDVLGQQKVSKLTSRLIDRLLSDDWMRTDLLLAHARLYFPEYAPTASSKADGRLADDLSTDDASLQKYLSYVLLDFATADRDLEEAPLAIALLLSEESGLKDAFLEIAKKELKLTKKQLDRLDREKQALIGSAEREAERA